MRGLIAFVNDVLWVSEARVRGIVDAVVTLINLRNVSVRRALVRNNLDQLSKFVRHTMIKPLQLLSILMNTTSRITQQLSRIIWLLKKVVAEHEALEYAYTPLF